MEKYAKLMTKLQLGKSSDIRCVKDADVDDIESIKIDTSLPKLERMLIFLNKVKNPYIFSVDGIKVKFEFSDNGNDINRCFENLINSKENI